MRFQFLLSFILLFSHQDQLSAQTLASQVEILRDTFGVPHILGKTDAAVAYGLAWAHAEDDFKTIQLTMLSGKQMLGRHLGKSGAAVDYVVGLMRCGDLVQRQMDTLSPEYLAVIRAIPRVSMLMRSTTIRRY